ncbi:hypothetical protein AMTRI_Chr12g275340 [Amborella trichopoda]
MSRTSILDHITVLNANPEGWTTVRRKRWQPPKNNCKSFNHWASHAPSGSATARPRPQHHNHGTHPKEIRAAQLPSHMPSSLIPSTSFVPAPPRFNTHHHPSPPSLSPHLLTRILSALLCPPLLNFFSGWPYSYKPFPSLPLLQPPFPGPATFVGQLPPSWPACWLPPSISLPYFSPVSFNHYSLLSLSPPVSSRLLASRHLSIPNHYQPFSPPRLPRLNRLQVQCFSPPTLYGFFGPSTPLSYCRSRASSLCLTTSYDANGDS